MLQSLPLSSWHPPVLQNKGAGECWSEGWKSEREIRERERAAGREGPARQKEQDLKKKRTKDEHLEQRQQTKRPVGALAAAQPRGLASTLLSLNTTHFFLYFLSIHIATRTYAVRLSVYLISVSRSPDTLLFFSFVVRRFFRVDLLHQLAALSSSNSSLSHLLVGYAR